MASVKDQLESSQEFQDAQRELADAQAASGGDPDQPPRSGAQNFQDMITTANDALDGLKDDPGCDFDANCGQQRDRLQSLVDGMREMQPSLDAAAKAVKALGLSNPNGLKQSMASLQQGADANRILIDEQSAGDVVGARAKIFALGELDQVFDFIMCGEWVHHPYCSVDLRACEQSTHFHAASSGLGNF